MEFQQLLADSILFYTLAFVSHPPQATIFLFSIVKGGVPLEYFSFLNLCQTAVSPHVFQFIFKCIFMHSTMLV